jgi:hypothetical protein
MRLLPRRGMLVLIGFDIDGVLFPWADVANDALVRRFGIADPGPHTTWLHLKNTITDDQWAWLWGSEGHEAIFGRVLPVYEDGVRAVNAILDAGHYVHFVTHRNPRRALTYTARFLDRHFGHRNWSGVHVVNNAFEKRTLAPWDVFVDDKPETVIDLLANTDVHVFMPDRPWNQELALEGIANGEDDLVGFARYFDAMDILDWVEGRAV